MEEGKDGLVILHTGDMGASVNTKAKWETSQLYVSRDNLNGDLDLCLNCR